MFTLAQSRIQSAVTSYKHCRMPVTWQAMYRISQVLPTPDCAISILEHYCSESLTIVGTTLSPSPTLLQFDVDSTSNWRRVPGGIVQLLLEFNTVSSPSGRTLTAAGLSPDAIAFQFDRPIHTQFYRAWSPYDYCDCKCGRICRGSSRWAVDTKHVHRWCYGGHQQHLPESAASASGGALPLRTAKDKRLLPWQLEPS